MNKLLVLAAVLGVAVVGHVTAAEHRSEIKEWKVSDGGNGHFYQVVAADLELYPDGISWAIGRDGAEAAGGYLATLTTEAENLYVFNNLLADPATILKPIWPYSGPETTPKYWLKTMNVNKTHSPHLFGPFIGGVQDSGGTEPDQGWGWVNGDPWSYSNWGWGEPNNGAPEEDKVHFHVNGQHGLDGNIPHHTWNDYPSGIHYQVKAPEWGPENPIAYVVEWDVNPGLSSFSAGDFLNPMGKKKKVGSTLPVKFQLYYLNIPVQSQEELNAALTSIGADSLCPTIVIQDVTDEANQFGIELAVDSNNGGEGDSGDCFRFAEDGKCIYNLRLSDPPFESEKTYLVTVKLGEFVIYPKNELFQTK